MADAERVRIEIAFKGGQTLSVNVPPEIADELDSVLAKGDSEALSFEAEDGRYTVAVRAIVFVKRHARESRVGFGAGH